MLNTIELAKELIKFKSTPHNLEEIHNVTKFVLDYVQKHSKTALQTKILEKNGYPTLIIATQSVKKPALTFYAHLDVVPAKNNDFTPVVKDNKLYGRGSGDMKGPAASLINAFITLVNSNPNYDICLFLPTDEESGGHNCCKHAIETFGFRTKCVIMPDSGSGLDKIITNQKGILFAEVKSTGLSSHGSRPWEGLNAIEQLLDFYQKLKQKFPKPESLNYYSTCNLSQIEGGETFNSVAANASLTLDIRTANKKDKKSIIAFFKRNNTKEIQIQTKFNEQAFEVSRHNKFLQLAKSVTESVIKKKVTFNKEHGGSDGRFFQKIGVPCIVNGVAKEQTHADNEYAGIKEIHQLEEFTVEFTKQFFELG
ncbi:M20/M25/M40 family metallo-hydrolase [bacterium]|jgi:succinyl-diaminopimelate desuccinylase|nr:M20/M25/M40 family metallo-hydrolase [bacterium]